MTREILFRGKRIDNGEWVQGSLIHTDDGKDRIATSILSDSDDNEAIMAATYIVDSDTVGQYTGFKDEFGNKIFEGDIIHVMGYKGNLIGKVYFGDGQWLINSEDFKNMWLRNDFYFWATKRIIEVVGNIFDNPELINGGDEDETD